MSIDLRATRGRNCCNIDSTTSGTPQYQPTSHNVRGIYIHHFFRIEHHRLLARTPRGLRVLLPYAPSPPPKTKTIATAASSASSLMSDTTVSSYLQSTYGFNGTPLPPPSPIQGPKQDQNTGSLFSKVIRSSAPKAQASVLVPLPLLHTKSRFAISPARLRI
ncbi:hypothetical protein C8R43DRAFT_1240472 [Mycena crocata]|nr:hypothetical protein C8R43DRAFT_1240472 [Mycena crocata]